MFQKGLFLYIALVVRLAIFFLIPSLSNTDFQIWRIGIHSWEEFPFSHPDSFQAVLYWLDTSTILSCREVGTMWRDWFNNSNTVWSGFLPKVVSRVLRKRVRVELEQVWEIRLDLLLDMVDECWTEEQEMSMAIKIERASKQQVWREFEVKPILFSLVKKFFFRAH